MSDDTATAVASATPLSTTDYSAFKVIRGNRYVDAQHVKRLAKKIVREGNLTQYFPIIVNENMEVIDGQHRLRALEQLGYPVYYEVRPELNIGSVISFNTGNRNWSWRDYAMSYADRGNTHYKQFLELQEEFKERFRILMTYTGNGSSHSKDKHESRVFYEGDMVIRDFALARRLLTQYKELADEAGDASREFAIAAYRFMRTPSYDHAKMLGKVAEYGETFGRCYTISDYLFAFEVVWKGKD